MQTKKVVVMPYDPVWREDFARIKAKIQAAVGEWILGVEHVGSTSVEGLCAKPCIDMDVVIEDYGVFDEVVKGLASIGYIHEGDLGIREREAFCYEGKSHLRTHHLYVCPRTSPELHRHTVFRDFLRSHPEAAREYGEVKARAAALYPNDIDGYMRYKSACIQRLYAECGLE